jgi:glycine/betaine/sarcosine/D-proline reductase family selenoprotein B
MRIVHYVNQFFGGKGGEEAAGFAPDLQDGAVGPGKLLEQVLGDDVHIVRSIIVGDNYAAENLETLTELVVNDVKTVQADLFVAGPCFEAGRYGVGPVSDAPGFTDAPGAFLVGRDARDFFGLCGPEPESRSGCVG